MVTLKVALRAQRITPILIIIAAYLALQSVAFAYLREVYAAEPGSLIAVLEGLTNSNYEANLPTWYATILLLSCALLLTVTAAAKRINRDPYTWHWIGLAIIFLYLSIDEAAVIHEELTDPLRAALNVTNYLYFAWMLVGIPLVLAVIVLYFRFLKHLPAHIRNLFLLAGFCYTFGALFIEAISANQWYLNEGATFLYMTIGTTEEFFEMLGAIVLIHTLIQYIREIEFSINLEPKPVDTGLADDVDSAPAPATRADEASGNHAANLTGTAKRRSLIRRYPLLSGLIAFGAGVNFVLIGWVALRELTGIQLGTESAGLLIAAAYLIGFPVGAKLAPKLPQSWFIPLGAVTFALHLALPVWFRVLFALFFDLAGYTPALVLIAILTTAVISASYSVFLPRFAHQGHGSLSRLRALQLAGSASGVALFLILGRPDILTAYPPYAAALLVILSALGLSWRWTAAFAAGGIFWLLVFPLIHYQSNSVLFETLHRFPVGTMTLYSTYSPYQKIDVLQSPDGPRYLFLDGVSHFASDDGSRLSVALGTVPASLLEPENALVIGAGSMQMERMIAPHAGHVTTIEVDPLVVEAGMDYFDDYNLMSSLGNRSIVIDDAAHFLANTTEQFHLISVDTPSSFTAQTTALYSVHMIQSAADRLASGGVLAVNITDTFSQEADASRRIAASLLTVFDEVMIVAPASAGWSFAYAAATLPFSRDELSATLREQGESAFIIFDTSAVRAIVGDALPITRNSTSIAHNSSLNHSTGALEAT
jgi:spermidine synthase